jgi:hypothetical protein
MEAAPSFWYSSRLGRYPVLSPVSSELMFAPLHLQTGESQVGSPATSGASGRYELRARERDALAADVVRRPGTENSAPGTSHMQHTWED